MYSDLPCFLVLPERTDYGNFQVLDCETCVHCILGEAANIAALGLEHFYAAFGLNGSRVGPSTMANLYNPTS